MLIVLLSTCNVIAVPTANTVVSVLRIKSKDNRIDINFLIKFLPLYKMETMYTLLQGERCFIVNFKSIQKFPF